MILDTKQCEAETGRELTWCRSIPNRVPRAARCILWISPCSSVVHGPHHMLREVLCSSITPFLPQLHPPLNWDIPIQSWRVLCVCPGLHSTVCSSPLLQVAVLYSKPSCHPAVLVSPESAGPSEGQAGKKLPSSLSNSPLYIYGWANPWLSLPPGQSGEQQGFSDRAFLKA